MPAKTVSVVIPSFNKGDLLRQTLESVLSQQGVSLDVVLIDDASTDGSWEIATEFRDRITAQRLDQNRGGPNARNVGASLSTGDYLMFLDADDLLEPGTLRGLVEALSSNPAHVAVCRWRQLREQDGEWVPLVHTKPLMPADGDLVRAWLTDNWYFPPCAVLWPRAVYESTGGWDEELQVLQDADLMVRALLRGTRLSLAERGQAWYRVHESGGSVSKIGDEASAVSRIRFLDNAAREAERLGRLAEYRESLGRAYFTLARTHAAHYPHIAAECILRADRYVGRRPFSGSTMHRLLWRVLGLRRKESIRRWLMPRRSVRTVTPVGTPKA